MTYTNPQIMIALCGAAYIDETPKSGETVQQQETRMRGDINAALQNALPGWSVAWGPALTSDRANMMYIAGNTATNQYALAIRGTDWSFVVDWLDDFTLVQIPAPYDFSVEIATGTALGIINLYNQQALNVAKGTQTTAISFFKSLPTSAQLFVSGHSLGGCLASAMAPWFVNDGIAVNRVSVYTYAAPSAGAQSFATYYNNLFGTSAVRYFNDIDLVPNGWATLKAIELLYSPWPTCPDFISDLINDVIPILPQYVQTGSASNATAISLPGKVHFFSATAATDNPIDDVAWAYEVSLQHAHTYYAQLLGAPQISAQTAKVRAIHQRLRLRESRLPIREQRT